MEALFTGEVLPLVAATLAAALLAPLLSERLRLPAAITLILVGLGLGLLPFGGAEGLVAVLSSLGLVFAFFVAGCEIDASRLARLSLLGTLFALVSFSSALLLGWVLGTRVLGLGLTDSLLLGAVFSAAGPFSKRFVTRIAQLEAPGKTSLLAVNDLGEILRILAFLALLAPRAPGSRPQLSVLSALPGLAWLLGATLLAFLVLAFIATRWFGRSEGSANLGFGLLASICFGAAAFAGGAGLPPVLGAMVAGLAVGRAAPHGSLLADRLAFASRGVFLPFALVPAGIALGATLEGGSPLARGLLLPVTAATLLLAFLPRLLGALPLLIGKPPRRWGGLLSLALAPGKESPALLYLLLVFGLGGLGPAGGLLTLVFLPALWLRSIVGDPEEAEERRAERRAFVPARQRGRRTDEGSGSCIVGLANPGTGPELLSLAFLLRPRGATAPLRPLVVCESSEGERELERAEYLLAGAIVAARDANVPLEPATLTAPTVAEGLVGAALERPDSSVVIGWNRSPHSFGAFSAEILDSLLRQTESLVVAARTAGGFAGIDRLVLALPQGVEKRPEAARAAAAVATLLAATGAGLTLLVQASAAAGARALFAAAKGRGGFEVEELESWKHATRAAKALAREAPGRRTGYAILAGRPGSAGWHPSFESMPRDFAQAFPDRPLLVLHFPGGGIAALDPAGPRGLFDEALEGGRVLRSMEEAAVTDALRRLLAASWSDDRRVLARLTALFTGIAQKEAIELEPGVILLHAHVPGIVEPLVFFGARPEGWRLLALEEPVRVLVVLCAPESQRPEQHLATLGELARLFKGGGLRARLEAPEAST